MDVSEALKRRRIRGVIRSVSVISVGYPEKILSMHRGYPQPELLNSDKEKPIELGVGGGHGN